MKKILNAIREYKKETILSPLFVILEVIMEVLIPLLMATLIDKGIEAGNMKIVFWVGLVLLAAASLSLLFGVLSGKYAAIASAGFAKNLRHDMFYKVEDYSFYNIDKFSSSSIITRLTTDVSNVQSSYQMMIRIVVRAPFMLICSLLMAFNISKEISLMFVCIMLFLASCLFIMISKASKLFSRAIKTYDELNTSVQENIRNIRVVKSFVSEKDEISKFEHISLKIYKLFTKAENIVVLNNPIMRLSMYSAILLISYIGGKLIITGNMTTGELTSLITYATSILSSLMMISMIYVMIGLSVPSVKRCAEILNETPDIKNPKKPVFEIKDGSIEFKKVYFAYDKNKNKYTLKNINLKINSGEVIGVIGGTGSAKSTLVNLIPRLYNASKGEVLVGGVNVKNYDIKTLRDNVSMVLQKNTLFSGTIKENLKWGNPDATDEEINEACEIASAKEFVESFPLKYDALVEQEGSNLSGGQKQRLCIARALLKKPKILILDDSTSAVDTKTDQKIREALKTSAPNVTKIIIAQRIQSVLEADKVIVMNKGKIIDFNTPKNLLNDNEIFKEIYKAQMEEVK